VAEERFKIAHTDRWAVLLLVAAVRPNVALAVSGVAGVIVVVGVCMVAGVVVERARPRVSRTPHSAPSAVLADVGTRSAWRCLLCRCHSLAASRCLQLWGCLCSAGVAVREHQYERMQSL
jgi:hypothetical protein